MCCQKPPRASQCPSRLRNGIPCSLNKVPNLPSCFFSFFPYCGWVYNPFCFPRNVILSLFSPFLKVQLQPHCPRALGVLWWRHALTRLLSFFSCSCAPSMFLLADQSPLAHLQGPYQALHCPVNTMVSLSLQWPFVEPFLCLTSVMILFLY